MGSDRMSWRRPSVSFGGLPALSRCWEGVRVLGEDAGREHGVFAIYFLRGGSC